MDSRAADLFLIELDRLLSPLRRSVRDPVFARGLLEGLGLPLTELAAFRDAAGVVVETVNALRDQLSEPPETLGAWRDLISSIVGCVESVGTIDLSAFQDLDSPAGLASELLDQLVLCWLESWHPIVLDVLLLLGVVVPRGQELVLNADETRGRLTLPGADFRLDRLTALLRDPGCALQEVYQPHGAALLAGRLNRLLMDLGVQVGRGRSNGRPITMGDFGDVPAGQTLLGRYRVRTGADSVANIDLLLGILERDSGNVCGGALMLLGAYNSTFQRGGWRAELDVGAPAMLVGYNHQKIGAQCAGSATLRLALRRLPPAPDTPALLLGGATGTRLAIGSITFEAWAEATTTTDADVGVLARLTDIQLVAAASDGDSFLSKALAGKELKTDFDLGLVWSYKHGLQLEGGAGFVYERKLDVDVGGIFKLTKLRAAMEVNASADAKTGVEAGLKLELSLGASLKLGPLLMVVERMGLKAHLETPASGQGNLGAFDLDLSFKPPTGIGLSIESEAVTGGGYLYLDPDKGRYAGVLELETKSFGLSAVGVLMVNQPTAPEWSLFMSLCATFDPGVQLGMGFVLNGVGGLFGANRRLDPAGLRAAVKAGQLDAILFPKAPIIDHADEIFAAIDQIFPPAPGAFVFGPMLKLGWGSPVLITAELGVFVSLPDPILIALLGQISIKLPDDKPVLQLYLDVAGVLDLSAGTVALDAELLDTSRLLKLALSGQMAFRANFKDKPGFLLSVGGFHPEFEPPEDVGPLRRMTLKMEFGDNVQMSLRAYFALTSNTLQLGAGVSISAKVKLGIELDIDGDAAFDALLIFKPFAITTSFDARVHVSIDGEEVLGVDLHLRLTGPSPQWHATGSARIEIQKIGVDRTWSFDKTFGDLKIDAPPSTAPVWAPMFQALKDATSWVSTGGTSKDVRLRPLLETEKSDGAVWLRPDGGLEIRQRIAPLNLRLEQMGAVEPAERGPFRLGEMKLEGTSVHVAPVQDLFAPGAFLGLAPHEKLSAPSFEEMDAGLRLDLTPTASLTVVAAPTGGFDEIEVLGQGRVRRPTLEQVTLTTPNTDIVVGAHTTHLAPSDDHALPAPQPVRWTLPKGTAGSWSSGRQELQEQLKATPTARAALRLVPALVKEVA